MGFAWQVALSHLRSRRSEVGIKFTLVSILGVTIGVTALIMVTAVMEGFEIDLRDKILGSNAHLVALITKVISNWRQIQSQTLKVWKVLMRRHPLCTQK